MNAVTPDFRASDMIFDDWLSSVLTAWCRSLLSAGLLIKTPPLSCWSAMVAFSLLPGPLGHRTPSFAVLKL
jgi:hypothetical protein